jgi:hypothetical protein
MLGRKDYTQEELDNATRVIDAQLDAYRKLVAAVDTSDPEVKAALEAFEPLLFDNMTLVLDRYFVHRLRTVTGKDANPLNEVELLADSLINNDGVFRANKVIKLTPEETVLKLEPGERVALSADRFEQLARAFLGEIDAKFV